MIRRFIERLKQCNNVNDVCHDEDDNDLRLKRYQTSEDKNFNKTMIDIESKIEKAQIELGGVYMKQKRLIRLSLFLYSSCAAVVILFLKFVPLSSIVSVLVVLGYILLGTGVMNIMASRVSKLIRLKKEEIEELYKLKESIITDYNSAKTNNYKECKNIDIIKKEVYENEQTIEHNFDF